MALKHYHHHLLISSKNTYLLEERRRQGFIITLHKIRADTNLIGNDLANAAAKMKDTQYDSPPESQKLKVDVGEVAPRPPHWFMYTVKPPPPHAHLGIGARVATLCQPRWSIPKGERLQMHAFTRPSQQFRHKVRHAILRSLHYNSLYRRLVIKNIEVSTITRTVGKA